MILHRLLCGFAIAFSHFGSVFWLEGEKVAAIVYDNEVKSFLSLTLLGLALVSCQGTNSYDPNPYNPPGATSFLLHGKIKGWDKGTGSVVFTVPLFNPKPENPSQLKGSVKEDGTFDVVMTDLSKASLQLMNSRFENFANGFTQNCSYSKNSYQISDKNAGEFFLKGGKVISDNVGNKVYYITMQDNQENISIFGMPARIDYFNHLIYVDRSVNISTLRDFNCKSGTIAHVNDQNKFTKGWNVARAKVTYSYQNTASAAADTLYETYLQPLENVVDFTYTP